MWMWIGPHSARKAFGAIGPRLLAKRPIHISYVPVPEWFGNNPKLYMDPQAQERTAWAVGGPNGLMEVVDMQVDGLPLPEWEPFAGLVDPVAEGVQDGCQCHDGGIALEPRH